MIKAALFDLDGVVFDTETQYTVFWGMIGREYHPEIPDFAHLIKGQTLVQIYGRHFSHPSVFAHIPDFESVGKEQARITARLDAFEREMDYNYIPGFEHFVKELRQHGVKCAVVTSSNRPKMQSVYARHPEFADYFDRVLTSEDFTKSKPHPECYLLGASVFGARPEECVGLEDSFNGLRAVRDSGAFTLGLSTTNTAEQIAPLADYVIPDYRDFSFQQLQQVFDARSAE